MKKIFIVALVALVIVSLFSFSVSAYTFPEMVNQTGADLDYRVTHFQAGSNKYNCSYGYSGNAYNWGHVLFHPRSQASAFEIRTNTPTKYSKGDRVRVSFTAVVPHDIKSLTIALSPCNIDVPINDCLTGNVFQNDAFSHNYVEIKYSFTYTFTSSVTNGGFYWILRSASAWELFGLSEFKFDISTDGSVIAEDIKDNANSNTDKLINGDGGGYDSSDSTDKIDGTISDITDAEKDALGGKTDEEIQQEVEDAFEIDDDVVNPEDGEKVSELFMGLLDCFGSGYETLLAISLTLGLAGFIIGRKWSNG